MEKKFLVKHHGMCLPFSRGQIIQLLFFFGFKLSDAQATTEAVINALAAQNKKIVPAFEIEIEIERILKKENQHKLLLKYLNWQKLLHLNRPLIILLSGASGVGKSTIATELASRLKIYRTIGTDTIRDVMRTFFSAALIPDLHSSSFELNNDFHLTPNKEKKILHHFLKQTESVMLGVKASVHRLLKENLSAIIEGVHLIPGHKTFLPEFTNKNSDTPIVIQVLLHPDKLEKHQSHFLKRDEQTGHARPSAFYLAHFEEIHYIQNFLYKQAQKHHIPIIETSKIKTTVDAILNILLQKIALTSF